MVSTNDARFDNLGINEDSSHIEEVPIFKTIVFMINHRRARELGICCPNIIISAIPINII